MKIVAISDTHNQHENIIIPECDILIHAGDSTGQGRFDEMHKFATWFNNQPARYKLFIPGNHEKYFESNLPGSKEEFLNNCPGAYCLINEEIVIEGIKIYGSPETLFFNNWAFNRSPSEIKKYWDNIPDDTNILVTHGPPYDILDETVNRTHVGDTYLLDRIKAIKPDLHIFGHIHHSHGQKHIDGTSFYNVSICDEMYYPSNPVTIIDYSK